MNFLRCFLKKIYFSFSPIRITYQKGEVPKGCRPLPLPSVLQHALIKNFNAPSNILQTRNDCCPGRPPDQKIV
jgi:hypothetical protein